MSASAITIHQLEGFDDPRCDAATWNALLQGGSTNTVFLTWEWQKAWWESFERRGLMLLAAQRNGEVIAIAPLFTEEGMIYLVGSGGSDYLDFIGKITGSDVLDSLLSAASARVADFAGFQFFHVPDHSRTSELLRNSGLRLNLVLREEGTQLAPATQLFPDADAALALTRKKSLLRHEGYFRRSGSLDVQHLNSAVDIEPYLDEFFQQHIDRWSTTNHPSLFHDERQRRFYRTLTRYASATGWLRFTRVAAMNQSIAFHFGFGYADTFMWYKPSFAVELARYSPGEVLLRHLLLQAIEEGSQTFDFGLGDEPFKSRFATTNNQVRNWGLYPADKPIPDIWQ